MKQTAPRILYGDIVAETIRQQVAIDVTKFTETHSRSPHIAVVLSHETEPSKIYVARKIEACQAVGIRSTAISQPCTQKQELISIISRLNNDPDIDAILVQLPLFPGIDPLAITDIIDPKKDVDCFSAYNLGKLVQGRTDGLIPCTPKGIVKLLQYYSIPIQGQNIAIVGRSTIVGKPLSLLLSSNSSWGNATTSLLHSHTQNMASITKKADIIIVAAGVPGLISGDMISSGAIVVDVGINRVMNTNGSSKLCGDVEMSSVLNKVSAITPVPRGVGPMTVASLLENTLLCAEKRTTI